MPELNEADHAAELAKVLDETSETSEVTLSVTDAKLAATALRHYADWLEANV
ncbi:hypothetical protein KIP88_37560 [Bradyrhizobium sp. SRL28]|uniref:hypothetical protein n=1 Tax=Bradyrhizobium sp. SRL28 TaxID=2836178 RepID=UPI001BDE6607|nr:hypothetical protein [Bradyrhizobium sp. SRL28]MBT1516172.1 hypothetical protein [Bradyrhizobium sp. SRL28]